MIGKIKGKLLEIENNVGLVETKADLCFKIFLTPSIIKTHKINDIVNLYTYLQVKEDGLVLFGFENKKQQQLFEMLLSVDGIGPKLAFSIISFCPVEKLFQAIDQNSIDFFCQIPGIGQKTAQKILLELSSKLRKIFELPRQNLTQEEMTIVEALVSLGFKKFQAINVLSKIKGNLSLEEKIKEGIKLLTRKK